MNRKEFNRVMRGIEGIMKEERKEDIELLRDIRSIIEREVEK